MVLLGGCTDEILPPPIPPTPPLNSDETFVTFSFGVENPVVVTRAVNENAITNLQLLLIHSDGTRYFYEPGDKRTLSVTIKRGVYKVYASTHIASLLSLKTMDEAVITFLYTPVYNEADTSIPMSFQGTADFSVGRSSSYTVNLVRTQAKLRFTVSAASNVSISRISLQSAPRQTKMFPQANSGYNYGSRGIGATGGSFTLYMPENLAGTVSSITNQRQRTAANAPANATYLVFEGEVSQPTNANWTYDRSKFEIVVYLGSNVTTDFNIRRNTDYRININIASDLSTDTRIEHSGVGYTTVERLTPDEKFIWCGFGVVPFVDINPYNHGSGQVSFKLVVSGYSREMQIQASSFTVTTASQTGPATVTGTLAAGRDGKIKLYYDGWNFAPSNSRVSYTLTFTDSGGNVTEYRRELRFANRSHVYVEPQYGLDYTEKIADVTTPDGYIGDSYNNSHYEVFHGEKELSLTIRPLSGYTFKGWYSAKRPYTNANLISTSPTITITVDRRDAVMVYARVEK